MLTVAPHPLLDLRAFVTRFPRALGDMTSPPALVALLSLDAAAPVARAADDDQIRKAVRDLLRVGGFKPTGRSKPASEYLLRASSEGRLGPINVAVDAGNAVSLHSGLPISVVDLDCVHEPLGVAVAAPGSDFVFNPSGQVIDVSGLLCLIDAQGPCANAVKDAQRSKTSAATVRTLSLIWGTQALPGRAHQAATWYRDVLAELGAATDEISTA